MAKLGSLLRYAVRLSTLGLLVLWSAAGCGNLIGLNEYEEVDRDPGGGNDCSEPGDTCDSESDCCEDATCVEFEDGALCAAECIENADCASTCCQGLQNGGGACAPLAICGGPGCRMPGATCDVNTDCCDNDTGMALCIEFEEDSPLLCANTCTTNADCGSMCCVPLVSGNNACAPPEYCEL